jgi:tetratricopeptide (TPR) repeat protein
MIAAAVRARVLAATLIAAVALSAAPVLAQTSMVKGKVTDAQGKPVEKATVKIEFKGGQPGTREVSTNRRGEFIQVGLQPGPYLITASKEGVGVSEQEIVVRLGDAPELVLALRPAGSAASAEDQKFRQLFEEGVKAAGADKHDEAIAKFNEALAIRDDCYACYMNLGSAYYEKKDTDKAEAAFKKAAEVSPEESRPYQALADLYNAAGKREQAAEMAAKAASLGSAGGASASDLYNQGVIFWNAGKIPEAKTQFEAAVKADPNYADAHYWLGMATLNAGDMANAAQHFENYLKLAPNGQYAEQAKGVLSSLKPQG